MRRHVLLVSLLLASVLTACGTNTGPAEPPAPADQPSGAGGRSLGGGSPPRDGRLSAARTFSGDYLRWRAGTVPPGRVRGASPRLRRALARSRITPAQRERSTVLRRVELVEEAPARARALATLRNADEGLDYGLPLELERRGDRWIVARIPADD